MYIINNGGHSLQNILHKEHSHALVTILSLMYIYNRHGRDCMVVRFTTTYVISDYHH